MMQNPIVQQTLGAVVAESLTQQLELQDILADAIKRIQSTEGTGVDPATGGRTPPATTDDGGQRGDRADLGRDRVQDGRA